MRAGRLLISCVNYAPEILGTAPYTRDLAEWFAGEGWDVRVVTTYPYYPEWRRRPGDPRLAYRRERRPEESVSSAARRGSLRGRPGRGGSRTTPPSPRPVCRPRWPTPRGGPTWRSWWRPPSRARPARC